MITRFLLTVLFFVGSLTLAQKNINQKNGVANYGYDVVSYFSGKPQEGSVKFAVKHQNVIYYFVNTVNKTKFQKMPQKYLPQYGGYCAFAMGDSGEKVEIDPKTFKITNGKLYLFYNKFFNNTLTSWNKDEKNLTVKANNNWNKYTNK
jgi:YHS domain-containing protein